jgi:hypothetical protein
MKWKTWQKCKWKCEMIWKKGKLKCEKIYGKCRRKVG